MPSLRVAGIMRTKFPLDALKPCPKKPCPQFRRCKRASAALKPLLPTWSEQVQGALATGFASPDDGHSWPVALVTMIVAGIVVEAIANLKLRALLVSSIEGITGTFALCSVALVRVAFDFVGLFLFWGACLLALNLLVESEILLFSTLDAVLAAIIKVRGFAIVVRSIFAPRNEHLRLLSLWMGVLFINWGRATFLNDLGAQRRHHAGVVGHVVVPAG